MSDIYTHKCIKADCDKTYEDTDQEPYYCESCKAEVKRIAEEIDKKIASRPSKRKAPGFEEQTANMQTVKGITFINLPKNG